MNTWAGVHFDLSVGFFKTEVTSVFATVTANRALYALFFLVEVKCPIGYRLAYAGVGHT